jgi:hypothetical protein
MSADEPRRKPIAPWTGVDLSPQPEQIANEPEDDTLEARESDPMPTGAVGPIFTTATPTGE